MLNRYSSYISHFETLFSIQQLNTIFTNILAQQVDICWVISREHSLVLN